MEANPKCSVCSSELSGPHCSTCGQEIKGKPITFSSMFTDVVSNIFSLERSVFASIFQLLRDPKRLIHNYWEGNRKYYPSPGKMFFYALAIAALHLTYVDKQVFGLDINLNGYKSHFSFWGIFFPILMTSSYLTFVFRKYSLAKNVVSLLYLASALYILITILYDLTELIWGDYLGALLFLVFLLPLFIWNAIVFTPSGKTIRIALNALLQMFVFSCIVAALTGLIYWNSPDSIG